MSSSEELEEYIFEAYVSKCVAEVCVLKCMFSVCYDVLVRLALTA